MVATGGMSARSSGLQAAARSTLNALLEKKNLMA